MPRAHFRFICEDRALGKWQNALCHIYETGTSTPVTDLFAAASGGSAVVPARLTSNSQGEIEGWLTTARTIDIVMTDNSDTVVYAGGDGTRKSFADVRETVEVFPTPAQLVKVINEKANVQDPRWGALGDNVDDTDALLAAFAAVTAVDGTAFFPPGTYRTLAEIPVETGNPKIEGASRLGSRMVNAVSDMFHWGVRDATIEHMYFESEVGGGHIFKQTAASTNNRWSDFEAQQKNDDKSFFDHTDDAGNHYGNHWTDFALHHVRTVTDDSVPLVNVVVSTSEGAYGPNWYDHYEIHSTGTYGFHIESVRDGGYVNSPKFGKGYWHVPSGGMIRLLGANGFKISEQDIFDLNVESGHRDLIYIGAGTHASVPPSRHGKIEDVLHHGTAGQLDSGVQHIKFETGAVYIATFDNIRQNTTGNLRIDYGGNTVYERGCPNVDRLNDSAVVRLDSGLRLPGSTTGRSTLRIAHGTAPTNPVDGDVWTTDAGAFIRINGVTKSIDLT